MMSAIQNVKQLGMRVVFISYCFKPSAYLFLEKQKELRDIA